jgi:hypothetical protein
VYLNTLREVRPQDFEVGGEGKEEGRYFRLASGPQLPSPNMAMETHPLKTARGAKSYRIVGERDLSVSAKDLSFGDIRQDVKPCCPKNRIIHRHSPR